MDSSNGHGHRDSTGRLDPTRGTRSVESGIPFLAVASRVGTEFGCFVSVFAFVAVGHGVGYRGIWVSQSGFFELRLVV